MTYWTDQARIEALVKLHDDGLSPAQIAAALFHQFREEVSRNAVIGKITRLNRGRKGKARPMPKPKRRAAPSAAALRPPAARPDKKLPPPPPMPPRCEPVAFEDVAAGQCRFPVSGQGAAMLCCGGEVVNRFAREGMRELTHCRFHFERTSGSGAPSPRPTKLQRLLLGVGY